MIYVLTKNYGLNVKNRVEKSMRKQAYVEKRKKFDKCVQRRKRAYWKEQQTELLNACENSGIFWKTIGKTGIGNERNKTIPMEVINENGVTSTSQEAVLQKWKTEFSNLYNGSNRLDAQNKWFWRRYAVYDHARSQRHAERRHINT